MNKTVKIVLGSVGVLLVGAFSFFMGKKVGKNIQERKDDEIRQATIKNKLWRLFGEFYEKDSLGNTVSIKRINPDDKFSDFTYTFSPKNADNGTTHVRLLNSCDEEDLLDFAIFQNTKSTFDSLEGCRGEMVNGCGEKIAVKEGQLYDFLSDYGEDYE